MRTIGMCHHSRINTFTGDRLNLETICRGLFDSRFNDSVALPKANSTMGIALAISGHHDFISVTQKFSFFASRQADRRTIGAGNRVVFIAVLDQFQKTTTLVARRSTDGTAGQ